MPEPELRVLSLGGGTQSSALLLMALHGELNPPLNAAIFADTGWEPEGVYRHLWFLAEECAKFDFPLIVVGTRNLRREAMSGSFAAMPLRVRNKDGKKGQLARQCTYQFKVREIRKGIRSLLGLSPRGSTRGRLVEQWIGISWDEIERMAEHHPVQYISSRWPLIEKRLTRQACAQWLVAHGYPVPPKSSCIGCPFHGNEYWRDARANRPDEWADAVDFDRALRDGRIQFGNEGMVGNVFLHDDLIPLELVDLRSPSERGQGELFDAVRECGGYCMT